MNAFSSRISFSKPSAGDLIAGVSVALLALPQGLAYAEIAGMPAKYGYMLRLSRQYLQQSLPRPHIYKQVQ